MRRKFRRRFKPVSHISSTQQILFLDTGTNAPEVEAAWQWLKTKFPAAHRIFPEQIPVSGQHHILWWHEVEVRSPKSEAVNWKGIRRFLKSGGRLFLSLAAVQAVVPLGLEKDWPDIAEAGNYDPQSKPESEWIAPQGFEIRGLMGFLAHLPSRENHSLSPFSSFSQLRTSDFGHPDGIYLWNAKAGAPYWRFGYGANQWPQGKVWGVHRYYIGFDPAQKLAWAYEKPHVLCVGAYLYFSDAQNLFRQHLEAFAESCLRHLLAKRKKDTDEKSGRHGIWLPVVAQVKKNHRLVDFPKWEDWAPIKWLEVSPHLLAGAARNEFFDLSGARVLLMGNEAGPVTEIWSHPLRLCKNVSLQIKNSANATLWESGANAEVLLRLHQIERRRQTENVAITERTWVGNDAPLAGIEWEFEGEGELLCELTFEVDFRLMWPYPEGALSKLEYQTHDRRGRLCCAQAHFSDYRRLFRAHFALAFEHGRHGRARTLDRFFIEAPPIATAVEDISDGNASRARVTFHWHLNVTGKQAARFVAFGGEASDPALQELLAKFPEQLPELYAQRAQRQYHVLEKFSAIDTPDPLFNAAARWAKLKTDAFVSHVPSLGRSLMAGFANTGAGWNAGRPGYAWFFGRDACWTAFAMLHYGDFESVKEVLRFFGRHQDVSGKIFHELTTSGAAHYDAADSTPLYVILMERYLNHSGDFAFVKHEWPHIEKAMIFLATTDRDNDGLIENTGVGHGWIEGGPQGPLSGKFLGAHAEHYLAGCWAEALHAASRLAMHLHKSALAEPWILQQQKVRNLLEQDFWNAKAGYFYHGKNPDGSFDPNVTALAAVPLLFGYGHPEDGIQALRRLASKSFNADWGVRLVADDHPFYNPAGYHYGSVWPLFTGWTALAEFRYGRWLQGLMHVKNSLRNFQHGARGCMEEVLHGETYQPAGVCPHQAWSESMILQPLYEGWLGLKPHALEHRLELAPYVPLFWPFFAAGPISVGEQQLLFYFRREENVLTFQFKARPFSGRAKREHPLPLRVDFKPIFPSTVQLEELRHDQHLLEVKPEERADLIRWPLSFEVSGETTAITLRLAKFFTVAPPFAEVAPGARSRGWVIWDQHVKAKTVSIEVEGEPATAATLEFVVWGYEVETVKGGKLMELEGERGAIAFAFPDSSQAGEAAKIPRYARQIIEVVLR
jgi:glycogen debranching enzyme